MTWPEAFAAVGCSLAFTGIFWAMAWADRPTVVRREPLRLNTTPCGFGQFSVKTKRTTRRGPK